MDLKCRAVLLILMVLLTRSAMAAFDSDLHRFEIETISDRLDRPWALEFLPDGDFLVTERSGALLRVSADGRTTPVDGVPAVESVGQGGLLDVQLDADYQSNGQVYLCFAAGGFTGAGTELARARLEGARLVDVETLFVAEPKSLGGRHFGCRIAFDADNHLYLSLGDRGKRPQAQDLSRHPGSVIRLERDGSVPADNPFVGRDEAQPEIYTYGNRNPQGMAKHPETGEIWLHEHGPQGGDEINVLRSGANFGWPTVTFGANYGTGSAIGEGTHKPGMVPPLYYWVPSIAPSGMSFYRGTAFPRWRQSLFVGSLKFRLLVRLELRDGEVIAEERLLEGELGRIRDVRTGPDGLLYLLTDANPGKLVRLVPAD